MSDLKTLQDTINVIGLREWGSGPLLYDGRAGPNTDRSGPAPVLANLGVVPDQAKATQTSGTCGRCSQTLFEFADPPSCLESKSPAPQLSERLGAALRRRLSLCGSMEYEQTWKLRVTPSGLRYWAHIASARRTSGSGVTGSPIGHPTPRNEDSEQTGAHQGIPDTLNSCSKLAGYPTPNTPSGGPNSQRENRGAGGADLEEVANLSASTADSTGTTAPAPYQDLSGHPTCSARDWKDTPGMAQTGTNPDGSERSRLDMLPRVAAMATLGATTESTDTATARTAGFRLNPGFSLWLMIGIPTIVDVWASCGVRAMQSCRRSRRSS